MKPHHHSASRPSHSASFSLQAFRLSGFFLSLQAFSLSALARKPPENTNNPNLLPPAVTSVPAPVPPVKITLPPHPWGVYAWGATFTRTDIPKDIELRGAPITMKWDSLEPEQGKYNFDKELRRPLEELKRRGLHTHIMLWVAPFTPKWLYDKAGVPRVRVPERKGDIDKSTYPYYFDERYQKHLRATVKAIADYVAKLPADLKERIIFVQVAEGATGDGAPYKGAPLDPQYTITREQWNAYRRAIWGYYQSVFQRADGSLAIPILVNGDANFEPENAWLLERSHTFGVKHGMFSHGYIVSDNIERLENWEKFRAQVLAKGLRVFTRGEEDAEWKTYGWKKNNPPAAFYWNALFALHCKLDVWNIPVDALQSLPLAETVRIFNRYAGHNDPDTSPVAFCALRRGLNAADTTAFPEDTYGKADKKNVDRYLAIAKAHAHLGAKQGDPEKALGGGIQNRHSNDYNDVGWNFIPGNFERFLTQLRPDETSIGMWRIDNHPYSHFVRRFDTATGRACMTFRIADNFFASPAAPSAVKIRVVYLDKGNGVWELVHATTTGEKVARRVTNADTGKWLDLTLTLPDAVWDHRLPGGGDLALRHASGADTTFHIIELERAR